MTFDWEKLLTVNEKQAAKLLLSHPGNSNGKLQIRAYSIPFNGTQQRLDDIIKLLRRQMLKYVFPEKERPEDIDWALARDKFGDNNPKSDGKLGEMLLYVLVEAFLKTPLMAYKLKDLSNPNDQVKGADGVFIGEYLDQKALLIGESKVHQKLSSAIKSSIISLQRFHDQAGPYANELLIAKKYPPERGIDGKALKYILAIIEGATDRIIVHPVFVSYDLASIQQISADATCSKKAEKALKAEIRKELASCETEIEKHKLKYPKPYEVFLDFFFLPVENTLSFRKQFYEMLHGTPYTPKHPTASKRK